MYLSINTIFNILLVRSVPAKGELRQKWIDAIQTHQKFDHDALRFSMCELHFRSEDMNRQRLKNHLNKDAIPSFFPNSEKYVLRTIIQ